MSEIKAGKLQAGISVTPANNFVLDPSADDGTLILRDSSGTALATLASGGEAELYARDNILGTVSESSGVPTGAIIERGNNANGEYVKFADGTMICTHSITTVNQAFPAWTPMYVSIAQTWTFPATFVHQVSTSGKVISAGATSGNYAIVVQGSASGTLSTGSFSVMKNTADAAAITYTVMAIGRWF